MFVHIPKTGGTSVYTTLGITEPGHKKLLKYTPGSFTVVRNPLDRLVSHFCYIKTKNSHYYKKHPNFKSLQYANFDDYIYLCESDYKFYLKPQCEFICDNNDNILVEHILKFENLQNDFNKFWDLKLLHINKSDRKKDWRSYYNSKTFEITCDYYNRDIKLFNYEKKMEKYASRR